MNTVQKLKAGLVAFLVLSWVGTPLVWADDPESPWKTLSIKAGGYLPFQDTNLRVDGTGGLGLGTEIDLEKDLDLDEDIFSYRIDAEWRFFDRHRLNFSFYDLSRDSTTTIGRDITIGDTTFFLGTTVESQWNYKVYVASYTWSFLQTNTYEVGLNFGAHITDVELGVRGTFGLLDELDAITLPLPVVGLTGAYAFTPKLILRANAGAFYLEIDEYDGSLFNADLDLEYNFWKYIGVGIGYQFFRLNVNVDENRFNGKATYTYHGAKAFLNFYF